MPALKLPVGQRLRLHKWYVSRDRGRSRRFEGTQVIGWDPVAPDSLSVSRMLMKMIRKVPDDKTQRMDREIRLREISTSKTVTETLCCGFTTSVGSLMKRSANWLI
jgi:hypothetical protein